MTYRLAAGILSKKILENEGHEIANFPRQADQPDLIDWIPLGDRDIYIPYDDLFESFDGGLYEEGNGSFEYEFWCTPLMFKYLLDNLTEPGRRDGIVTVETENKPSGGGGWITVVARMQLRDDRRNLQREGGIIFRVTASFVDAYPAAEGADLTLALDDGESPVWQVGVAQDLTVTVSNIGDFATTEDSFAVIGIPAKLDLDGVSAPGWVIEYNHGGGQSTTPPGDLTTVTSLQFTRSEAIAPGGTADAITVTFIPSASGSEDILAAVYAGGIANETDVNPANNSATLSISIDPE